MKTYKDIVGDGGSDMIGQITEQAGRVQQRMASVKNIVAIMSGKGGVGKSSLTVNLAAAMADRGLRVGILDADINGASIARMTGASGSQLSAGETGVRPAIGHHDIKVMSIDLWLSEEGTPVVWDAPTQKDAFTWRGMVEAATLREFISDTEWGELDYLFIDLPPGTDKLPNMVDLLPQLSGTIIVTIPSAVSQYVVGKSIRMATELLKTPVIGLVENMSAYICEKCGKEEALFPSGHVSRLAEEHQVPYLGKIPFDPRIAVAADNARAFVTEHRDTPAGKALLGLGAQIENFVQK